MTTDIERPGTDATTVRDVTYELLRAHGLTTIFGNLGSTEETFLANFALAASRASAGCLDTWLGLLGLS